MLIEEQADLVMRCAYLVAVGDAHLAEEEKSHLSLVRGEIRRMLHARSAIEAFENGVPLEAASEMFDPATPVELSIEGLLGLPPVLLQLHKARQGVSTQHELRSLEENQARDITDPFLQKTAYYFCTQVASADGVFEAREQQTLAILSDVWGLSHEEAVKWYNEVAFPVLTGEAAMSIPDSARGHPRDQVDDRAEEETAAELRRLLGIDDPGTDSDGN
ncbi:hypothetical protein [Parafrankia sp. BMG5.11]|uniref:hypothetical protein n=1 Tax=Parafrankia sp. BMG5.11 TaxID=222540 RepID=UPI00103ADDE4|nr:hypothetical protein [Parafrankia sp. BMG5.11]TCJ41287.1 hypothetical protein E0504_01355 [Parafrankia sp. BMG5.11]